MGVHTWGRKMWRILWRENERREAGSKHSEIMAEGIEASDGETTADGRNRRHPDGVFGLNDKEKEEEETMEILA